ncbi:MAG: hypothetical protein AAFO15_00190 [Pseudomonadota bacterium]
MNKDNAILVHSFNVVLMCCIVIFAQSVGYYFLKIGAKNIKSYFLGDQVNYNFFYLLVFGYTFIAKLGAGIIAGVFADIFGLARLVQVPIILTVISLGIFFLCPSYAEIGTNAVVLYSIAHILYQVSIASEMQNIRLYITSLVGGYAGEVLVLMPKYFSVLLAIVLYQFVLYFSISFQYVFLILFVMSCIVVFLRNNLVKVNLNEKAAVSVSNIITDVYDKFANHLRFLLSQMILYGAIGGILYFYCIFIEIFFNTKLDMINGWGMYLQLLILFALCCGALIALILERYVDIYWHVIYSIVMHIIIIFIIIKVLYNVKLLFVAIIFGAMFVGMSNIPLFFLLRQSLPNNNKGTFASIVKNVGSLILSNTTLNMCFSLFSWSGNIAAPFYYVIFLCFIKLIAFLILYYQHQNYSLIR